MRATGDGPADDVADDDVFGETLLGDTRCGGRSATGEAPRAAAAAASTRPSVAQKEKAAPPAGGESSSSDPPISRTSPVHSGSPRPVPRWTVGVGDVVPESEAPPVDDDTSLPDAKGSKMRRRSSAGTPFPVSVTGEAHARLDARRRRRRQRPRADRRPVQPRGERDAPLGRDLIAFVNRLTSTCVRWKGAPASQRPGGSSPQSTRSATGLLETRCETRVQHSSHNACTANGTSVGSTSSPARSFVKSSMFVTTWAACLAWRRASRTIPASSAGRSCCSCRCSTISSTPATAF